MRETLTDKNSKNCRIFTREASAPPDVMSLFSRFENHEQPFLLESGMIIEGLGRYSFMGAEPFLIFSAVGRDITITKRESAQKIFVGNPFYALRELLSMFHSSDHAPIPFATGAVGYFAYDLCHHIERLPKTTVRDIDMPEMYMAFYDRIVAVDHIEKRVYLVANDLGEGEAAANIKLDELEKILGERLINPAEQRDDDPALTSVTSNFSRDEYLRAVARSIEYIAAGDIFQVNLSQRFHARINTSPAELYRRLRSINPAPFAGYIGFGDSAVVSASPERFLHVEGRHVQTRPIKGTRPRGRDDAEDERLGRELLASEKDNAELAMIVDLERNDLGRVCEYGTVRVTEPRRLEVNPTVFHLVATVEGMIHPRFDIIDLLRASFPGGSITGAPKIRAMEIIDELEPTRRSVYTGSMGYIGFDGRADLNIVIRTFIFKGNDAWFQAGGGIVADSDPAAEYDETLDKARALISAVGGREDFR